MLLLAVARPTDRRTLATLVTLWDGAHVYLQKRAADADPRPVKRLSSSRRVLAALRRVDERPPVQATLNGADASVSSVLVADRLRRRVSRQTITDGIVILTRALS